jgi:hypothetical protein
MHRNLKKNLGLPESRRWIGYRTNHLGLLNSQDAYDRIRSWLQGETTDTRPESVETA